MPKTPATTGLVPNPLHQFASYTYSLSLWWMDPDDYNALMSIHDVDKAMAFNLSNDAPKSYVVAEDGGLFPSRRLPTLLGLNYNIQDLEIEAYIGPSDTYESSSGVNGTFTILEPYGFTLLDGLSEASWDGKNYINYVDRVYVLQINFVGYDDNGNAIPSADTAKYTKRFPIQISDMQIEVTTKGTEYKCSFLPAGHEGHTNNNGKTPLKDIIFTAGTIDEFFNGANGLAAQINKYWVEQIPAVTNGDYFSFDIDPEIAKSTIVNPNDTGLVATNPNSKDVDSSKPVWHIPRGSSILSVITKIMAHSSYLIDQLQLETTSNKGSQATIINMFRTQILMLLRGTDRSGTLHNKVFDKLRNCYARSFEYKIHQAPTWKGSHPALPQFPDSRNYTVKVYNFLYTGQNLDVIDFKVKFDNAYLMVINGYQDQIASTIPSPNSGGEEQASYLPTVPLTPTSLSLALPQLGKVPVLTPFKLKRIVGNQSNLTGLNIVNRPAAVTTTDVIHSTYTSLHSSMVDVDIEIVGDPTLLKQDDWAFVPSPNSSTVYNSWDTMGQDKYAATFGQLRLDVGDFVVGLVIETPIDLDTDWTDTGLVFPQPGTIPSMFSGQFYVTQINSSFRNGVFSQKLHLCRYINDDYIKVSAKATNSNRASDAVSNNQSNAGTSVPSNGVVTPVPVVR